MVAFIGVKSQELAIIESWCKLSSIVCNGNRDEEQRTPRTTDTVLSVSVYLVLPLYLALLIYYAQGLHATHEYEY